MADIELTPFLSVQDARGIAEFYKKAFGAGDVLYALDENPAAFNVIPATPGGTTVRMRLIVADPDAVEDRAVAASARVVIPVRHHWLIGKRLR